MHRHMIQVALNSRDAFIHSDHVFQAREYPLFYSQPNGLQEDPPCQTLCFREIFVAIVYQLFAAQFGDEKGRQQGIESVGEKDIYLGEKEIKKQT